MYDSEEQFFRACVKKFTRVINLQQKLAVHQKLALHRHLANIDTTRAILELQQFSRQTE